MLYDPLSYYRPWRQAREGLNARQRGSLNAWLIERHALPGCSEVRMSCRVLAGT